jgi:DNA ligase-1
VIVLEQAISAIIELQNATGSIAKKQIIERHRDNETFRRLLYYALHPLLSYKVSEKTLKKDEIFNPAITLIMTDVFEVCELLSSRRALDDITVYQVKGFLAGQPEPNRTIFQKLLAKTLRLGVTAKTVNKVIPGLIPEWEVQQAYPIEKYPLFPGEWFALTEKLNGVRATYYRGRLYARSGEEHKGMDHIEDFLRETVGLDMVFDGELTLSDKSGLTDNEAFRKATGIINADIGTCDKTVISFTVFDVLPACELDSGSSSAVYSERRAELDSKFEPMFRGSCVHVLPLMYAGTDQKMIDVLLAEAVAQDKEGLMCNLDVPYKCKRHNGILKIKQFYTMDLLIVGCEEGSGRLANRLGAFVLDFKGNEVRVGSGFTDEERFWFWQQRESMVGKLCEVKYKEISQDKHTGAESLQFPVFVTLRTDKTEPSFG